MVCRAWHCLFFIQSYSIASLSYLTNVRNQVPAWEVHRLELLFSKPPLKWTDIRHIALCLLIHIQIINPSIKPIITCLYRHWLGLTIYQSIMPTAICEVVNDLIGVLSPSWLLANWYTKTFIDWACRYKEGYSQVIKVIGTNMVCRYT